MAFADLTEVRAGSNGFPNSQLSADVGTCTDWVIIRPAGEVDAADNSGSTILDPSAITVSRKILVGGHGTGVLIRLSYKSSALTTNPVIQVFGIDANELPMRLYDSNGAHELTLAVDATNDIDDGTNSYTAAKEIDAKGNKWIIIGVKTAAAGASATTMVIQARVI